MDDLSLKTFLLFRTDSQIKKKRGKVQPPFMDCVHIHRKAMTGVYLICYIGQTARCGPLCTRLGPPYQNFQRYCLTGDRCTYLTTKKEILYLENTCRWKETRWIQMELLYLYGLLEGGQYNASLLYPCRTLNIFSLFREFLLIRKKSRTHFKPLSLSKEKRRGKKAHSWMRFI